MVVYVFAQDYSGSTSYCPFYHQKCRKTFAEFISDRNRRRCEVSATYLCLWDDNCIEIDEKELRRVWKDYDGQGGTEPVSLPTWYLKKMRENTNLETEKVNLWLVTDGEIDEESINKARSANEKILYENIKFFIFNRYSKDADISVGLGFLNDSTTLQVYVNNVQNSVDANLNLNFKYEDIKTHEDLTEKRREELFIFVGIVGMVRAANQVLEIMEEIKKMRDRVLASIKDFNRDDTLLSLTFEKVPTTTSALLQLFQDSSFYQYMIHQSGNINLKHELDSFFTRLLEKLHNSQQQQNYGFSQLKYNREVDKLSAQKKSAGLEEADVPVSHNYLEPVTLQEEDNTAMLLLCPISLLQEVWENGSRTKYQALLECPFLACNPYLQDCVDHVISIGTFNKLIGSRSSIKTGITPPMIVSPITRTTLYGGIVPYRPEPQGEGKKKKAGKNYKNIDAWNDYKNIDAWNDYMMSWAFFEGTSVSNKIALWYYALYVCVRTKTWVPESVKEDLREYALHRMRWIRIPLSLSSLPTEPKIRAPVPLAFRYCLDISSYLFAENPKLFKMERLRKYAGFPSEVMLEILRAYGHTFDDENFILNRIALWNEWSKMRKMKGGKFERLQYVMSQIFETRTIGDVVFLIANEEDSSTIKTENAKYVFLFANWLKWITTPVPLTFELKSNEEVLALVRPLVFTSYKSELKTAVPVCPATWRPYFKVQETDLPKACYYRELLKSVKDWSLDENIQPTSPKTVDRLNFPKIISLYKCYIDFVHKFKRYPKSIEEYADFVHRRYSRLYVDRPKKAEDEKNSANSNKVCHHERKKMLIRLFPSNIVEAIGYVYEAYEKTAAKSEAIGEFIRKTIKSADRISRLRLEDKETAHFEDAEGFTAVPARNKTSIYVFNEIDDQFLIVNRRFSKELNVSRNKRKQRALVYWKKIDEIKKAEKMGVEKGRIGKTSKPAIRRRC